MFVVGMKDTFSAGYEVSEQLIRQNPQVYIVRILRIYYPLSVQVHTARILRVTLRYTARCPQIHCALSSDILHV